MPGSWLLPALGIALSATAAPDSLTLRNLHTGEVRTVAGWRDPATSAQALEGARGVLRDHRDGAEHPVDPRLLDLLVEVAARCETPPDYEVISGYRSPHSNSAMHARSAGVAAKSQHVEGRAIDVRLKGCELARLNAIGLELNAGGVGYYPRSRWVHFDTGRPRHWSE